MVEEVTEKTVAEEQAFQLTQAAFALDQARNDGTGASGPMRMAAALERNMGVWLRFKAIVALESCSLSKEVKDNIDRLANYVADKTLQGMDAINDSTIESFISINLQISEGLLEGSGKAH